MEGTKALKVTSCTNIHQQSNAELLRLEEEERAQMEMKEREMFREQLRRQRLESEADSKWLQQEEQNIDLPFSPPPVRFTHITDFVLPFNRVTNRFHSFVQPRSMIGQNNSRHF